MRQALDQKQLGCTSEVNVGRNIDEVMINEMHRALTSSSHKVVGLAHCQEIQ